jgi:hypothetical protein
MDAVSRLFPGPGNRRTTRVGIEHELLTRDSSTGAVSATSPDSSPARSSALSTGQVSCWLAIVSPLTYLQTGTATVPPPKVTAS